MEVQQCAELTGTNRSCDLAVFLRQVLISRADFGLRSLASTHHKALRAKAVRYTFIERHCTYSTDPKFPVAISTRPHPIPSRTRKLSLSEPMVLHGKPCGRVGRRRDYFPTEPPMRNHWGLSCFCGFGAPSAKREVPLRCCAEEDHLRNDRSASAR